MEDILTQVFRLINNLTVPSGVCKQWNELINKKCVRHPIEAARIGDSYSIGRYIRISRRIYATLIKHGHVGIARALEPIYDFTPTQTEKLKMYSGNILRRIILASYYDNAAKVAERICKLGPDSEAYRVWEEMKQANIVQDTTWDEIIGFCKGGHLTGLISYHDAVMDYLNDDYNDDKYCMFNAAIKSGDIHTLKHIYDLDDISVQDLSMKRAVRSGNVDVLRFMMKLAIEDSTTIVLKNVWESYKNVSKDVMIYLKNAYPLDICSDNLAELEDDEVEFLYKEGKLYTYLDTLCRHGHLKAAAAYAKKKPTEKCKYCNGRYH